MNNAQRRLILILGITLAPVLFLYGWRRAQVHSRENFFPWAAFGYNGLQATQTAMDSLFVLFALFAAGVLHGLGPDHLAAIAALAGQGTGRQVERRELALLGLRFGIGHVSTLVLLAVVVWALGRATAPATRFLPFRLDGTDAGGG